MKYNILDLIEKIKLRKKIIISFTLFGLISSSIIAFLLPNIYYSYSVIKPSEDSGVNILSSVLGAKGLSGIQRNLSIGNLQYSDLDYFKTLILSRSIAIRLIDEFDLRNVYRQKYYFKTINELHQNTTIQLDNKSNVLIVGVYDKKPERAYLMLNKYLNLLDSLVKNIKKENLIVDYEILESRYLFYIQELQSFEDSMKQFQQKYGIIIPTEQYTAAINTISELEIQKTIMELELDKMNKLKGVNSPESQSLREQIKFMKDKINSLTMNIDTKDRFKFIPSFNLAPEILLIYSRLFQNIQIRQKLIEFIYPLYEQLKMDLKKESPAFIVIDKPFIPEYKSKPKRAIIILTGTFLMFIFSFIYIYLIEFWNKNKNLNKSDSDNSF
jgi:uncharacterized protein involved in exopolysaccharide biosynthesis